MGMPVQRWGRGGGVDCWKSAERPRDVWSSVCLEHGSATGTKQAGIKQEQSRLRLKPAFFVVVGFFVLFALERVALLVIGPGAEWRRGTASYRLSSNL